MTLQEIALEVDGRAKDLAGIRIALASLNYDVTEGGITAAQYGNAAHGRLVNEILPLLVGMGMEPIALELPTE